MNSTESLATWQLEDQWKWLTFSHILFKATLYFSSSFTIRFQDGPVSSVILSRQYFSSYMGPHSCLRMEQGNRSEADPTSWEHTYTYPVRTYYCCTLVSYSEHPLMQVHSCSSLFQSAWNFFFFHLSIVIKLLAISSSHPNSDYYYI